MSHLSMNFAGRCDRKRPAKGSRKFPGVTWVLMAAILSTLFVLPAWAQRVEPAPGELQNVGVTEHLGAQVPLELPFRDSSGRAVKLGDFFDGQRPVVLTLNYSNCPMLCSLQLNGLVDGLTGLSWSVGNEFRAVTVSIDPKESPERAQLTKQKYLKMYRREGAASGWHFLVGEEQHIRRLADTVGFGYAYLADQDQYAHAAVAMICSPDGRVARYLYGIEYPPQTLRLALVEAAEGKIGTTLDRFLLYCFHYDASERRYVPTAQRIMRIGGVATLIAVAGILLVFWRREQKRRSRTSEATALGDAESAEPGSGQS